MRSPIFDIEEKYSSVFSIQLNGIKIWPIYRTILRFLIINKNQQSLSKKTIFQKIGSATRKVLSGLYNGLKLLANYRLIFCKYDVVFFTNQLEKKELNGRVIDKLVTGVIEELKGSYKRILIVDYQAMTGANVFPEERSIAGNQLEAVAATWPNHLRWSIQKLSKKDKALVSEIKSSYGLIETGIDGVKDSLARASFYKALFMIWKPNLAFFACYSYYSQVFAAKSLGIRTIELQHGLISPDHPAYDAIKPLNRDFTADYLFAYGRNTIAELSEHIVKRDNVLITGNYYLEKILTLPPNKKVIESIEGYDIKVCIPTHHLTEKDILPFISEVSLQMPNAVFIINPRSGLTEKSAKFLAPYKNIVIIEDVSFHEIVKHCTFHTATISTCCLEANSLGIPNILIDIPVSDAKPSEYYGNIIDSRFTFFVETVDEYIDCINKWHAADPQEIINANSANFLSGYQKHIKQAIEKVKIV